MYLSSVPYVLRRTRLSWAVMSTCRGYIESGNSQGTPNDIRIPRGSEYPGNSYWYWVGDTGRGRHTQKTALGACDTPVWLQHTLGGDFQMSQHRSSSINRGLPPHCLVPEALHSSDDVCIRSLLATFHERRGVDMLSSVKARSSSPAWRSVQLSAWKRPLAAGAAAQHPATPAVRKQNRLMGPSAQRTERAESERTNCPGPAERSGTRVRRFASRAGRWDELNPRLFDYRERKAVKRRCVLGSRAAHTSGGKVRALVMKSV